MENITTIARLFKHGDRHFTIIHETNAVKMLRFMLHLAPLISGRAFRAPLDFIVMRFCIFFHFI